MQALMYVIGFLGVTTFLLILFPAVLLWRGFVLSKLWLWFLVPLGAPVIVAWHAAGICLVMSMFTNRGTDQVADAEIAKRSNGEKLWRAMFDMFMLPLIFLGVGWVVHRWLM